MKLLQLVLSLVLLCSKPESVVSGGFEIAVDNITTVPPPEVVNNGEPVECIVQLDAIATADGTVEAEWGAFAKRKSITTGNELDSVDVNEGDTYVVEFGVPIAAVDGNLYYVADTEVHRKMRANRNLQTSLAWWQNLYPLDSQLILKVYQILYGSTPKGVTPPPLETIIRGAGPKILNVTVIINKVTNSTNTTSSTNSTGGTSTNSTGGTTTNSTTGTNSTSGDSNTTTTGGTNSTTGSTNTTGNTDTNTTNSGNTTGTGPSGNSGSDPTGDNSGGTDTNSTGTDAGSTGSTDTNSTNSGGTGSTGGTDTNSTNTGGNGTGSTGGSDTNSTTTGGDTGSTGGTDTNSTGGTGTGSTGGNDTNSTTTGGDTGSTGGTGGSDTNSTTTGGDTGGTGGTGGSDTNSTTTGGDTGGTGGTGGSDTNSTTTGGDTGSTGGTDTNSTNSGGGTDTGSGTADSCPAQKECVKFNMTKIHSQLCGDSKCEYKVCMIIDQSGSCQQTGSFSHTCVKDEDVCQQPNGFAAAMEVDSGLVDGFVQCQIIGVNETAQFLLQGGNSCEGTSGKDFGSGHRADCGARSDTALSTCSKDGAASECVWTVKAPTSCGNTGGGGGDPHFKVWNETRFPFHGECDLVLMENPHFYHGAGLDIHVRTTMDDFYSFIEFAAIRIGSDIFEITRGGQFWLNGVEGSDGDLPDVLADFTISAPFQEEGSHAIVYRIDLNNGDYIKVRAYKKYISLDVFGLPEDFENSVGLLGHYHTGDMIARDGRTIIDDPDAFGMEWQVRQHEPQLFREPRAPFYPSKCIMPAKEVAEGRRLGMRKDASKVKEAEQACSHKNKHDFEFCVFDVLATGDLGMANAW